MVLDPTWSLNRVYIANLPGLDIPDGVKGKTAYELVSAEALARLVRQQVTALQLEPNQSDHALRLGFDVCLQSDTPSIRAAANEVARTIGRSFGYVLLTLKRGDQVNRDARPEWTAVHWERWSGITRVWLGGGLVSGNLGPHIAHCASQVMQENGVDDYVIRVSPYGAALPLVGAARYVPPGADSAAVLDFGSTVIKCAWVTCQNNQIVELCRLPEQAVRRTSISAHYETALEQATGLIDGMVATIFKTWMNARRIGFSPSRTIPMSVAAYVQDGKPLTGIYGRANLVTDNLARELGSQLSAKLGASISVKLLHDGTAAAAAYAGERDTAVIMLGTALGIGFPGEDAGLQPMREGLAIGLKCTKSAPIGRRPT